MSDTPYVVLNAYREGLFVEKGTPSGIVLDAAIDAAIKEGS